MITLNNLYKIYDYKKYIYNNNKFFSPELLKNIIDKNLIYDFDKKISNIFSIGILILILIINDSNIFEIYKK